MTKRRPAGGARLGTAARLRRAERHPPVQAGGRPAARRALRGRPRPRRRQHRRVPRRPACSGATPTGRATAGRSGRCCPTRCTTGRCSSAPAVPGSRSATACCARAPSTSRPRPRRRPRAGLRRAAGEPLRRRPGLDHRGPRRTPSHDAQGVVNATPIGMHGHPGSPVPGRPAAPDLWVSDVVYFPLETELVAAARARGCRVLARRRHGRPAGGRRLRVLHRPARGLGADGAPLRGADRPDAHGHRDGLAQRRARGQAGAAAGAGFDTHRALRQRPDRLADEPARGGRALRRPRARDRAVPAGPRRRGGRARTRSTPCCTGSARSSG